MTTNTQVSDRMESAWGAYVQRFHAEHAGITERVLSRCRAGPDDPYAWCAQPVGDTSGAVVDVGCGSGPMATRLRGWVGVDSSAAELAAARSKSRAPVVLGDGRHLPIATGAADAAVAAMSLQIIEPLGDVLAEIARVVRPGGLLVALLPATRPMPVGDGLLFARLQLVLRARIRYPNDDLLAPRRLAGVASRRGLRVVTDDSRAFRLPLRGVSDVAELVGSLYLPSVDPARRAAANRVLRARIGREVTMPLRRVVFDRVAART